VTCAGPLLVVPEAPVLLVPEAPEPGDDGKLVTTPAEVAED
jgi:hypothetical protein